MRPGLAISAVTLTLPWVLATAAFAAPAKPMRADHLSTFLMDHATATQLWKENTPPQISRLYPPGKFRFISDVSGGFNDSRICVVTARAMLLPVVLLPIQGAKVVYAPVRSATTFDAAPSLNREQCQQLAKTKLKEAIQSVMSSLTAS